MTREQLKLIRTRLAAAGQLDARMLGAAILNGLFQIAIEEHKQSFHIAHRPLLKFACLLANLTDNVDSLPGLLNRYPGYNLSEEHCLIIGNCMLLTLDKGLQQGWTEEIEEAWVSFIQQVVREITLKQGNSNVA
jgi:hemoglobin-like flavoprotein